ncbi:MAG: hypothetical protein JXR22_01945 [Prolixibacteraceae bacterium]|nr:hypothetical protein [Prolixibacteraceae bacterium]
MKRLLILLLPAFMLLGACQKNRLKVDVSHIDLTLTIHRFDQVLFEKNVSDFTDQLGQGNIWHQDFIDGYFQDIIRVGDPSDQVFVANLQLFVSDTVITQVADKVQEVFPDFSDLSEQLNNGFRHFNFYFPQYPVPEIYTCITGFNQSLFIAEEWIAISLDNYLGSDCVFYNYLGIPQYKINNMYPEKMVSDLFYALGMTTFPGLNEANNLLSAMIHEGKMHYFTEAMCPDMPDTVIIGYTKAQLEWCKANEAGMWSYWAEHKLLYNMERLILQKYIADAPFTNTFANESPGRTGAWTGWQIVRSYMNKHPEVSLELLMEMQNAQEILNQSGYFPE